MSMSGRLHRPTAIETARRDQQIGHADHRRAVVARVMADDGARSREMARSAGRHANKIEHVHGHAAGRADATHIGSSDPHAREYPTRLVPASVTVNRPAEQDSAVRYAGMYYREPIDRATGQPIEVFGRTMRAANAAAYWLSKRSVADAVDSIIRPDKRK